MFDLSQAAMGTGIILLLIGIALIFIGTALGAVGQKGKVEGAGVIMLGPIPLIGAATSRKMGYAIVALIIIGIILWVLLGFFMKK